MDNPIFKLEKVVQGKGGEVMEDFEGPLDLILFLLSKNKIEIQDIPIALILEQYLEYLEVRKQMDLEVASEFITMAAHLMYIKTRMLLSLEDEEAQSEMEALIQSLEERKRGETYAKQECIAPQRVITAAAPVKGTQIPVSVKTAAPVPKEKIQACMQAILNMDVSVPVHAGDVLIHNVCGTGVDVVATRTVC